MARRRPSPPAQPLTARQVLVTSAIVAHGQKEAARRLEVSTSTVRNHLRAARHRVGVETNLQLAYVGGRDGWLRVSVLDD